MLHFCFNFSIQFFLTSIVIFCPVLPDPVNGIVSVTTRTVNSLAIYSCNILFGVSGSPLRTCREDGEWDGEEPVCIKRTDVECPNLETPVDGTLFITSNNLGGIASYSCGAGFMLVGIGLRLCESSNEWSGTAPTCRRKCVKFVLFCC